MQDSFLKRNLVRLAETWMDEYAQYYYQRIGYQLVIIHILHNTFNAQRNHWNTFGNLDRVWRCQWTKGHQGEATMQVIWLVP